MSRSANCARTVCETERSASRSLTVSLRRLQLRRCWRRLLRDHAVDHPPTPHGPGVDVEIVEHAVRIFVHRLLLSLENDLVLAEDAGDPFADFRGDLLLGDAVVAHKGPEVVTGGLGLRGHGVEHVAVDALGAVAL